MEDFFGFEWSYTPEDLFEEPIFISHQQYEIEIGNGKVLAKVKPEYCDEKYEIRNKLHDLLISRFLAAQIVRHIPFLLSKGHGFRQHPDGRTDTFIFPDPNTIRTTLFPFDIICTDQNGKVTDTRRERINSIQKLGDLAEKFRGTDLTTDAVLRSYQAAVNDPGNELIHLYEIRDALNKRFKNEKAARKALGVSHDYWNRLGKLANFEPLRQGRHRGENVGNLLDATESELNEARKIARDFIQRYLNYLDQQGP